MAETKARQRKRQLVLSYLEGISSRVFSEFSQEITELVGQRQGVYALYKGDRLYYVGLATNLRRRVKQHLRDKHAGKWNKFSMYLVRKSDHIKELESLILRIADPAGNTVRGGFADAHNLRPVIRRRMKATTEKRIDALLGRRTAAAKRSSKSPRRRAKPARAESAKAKSPALAPYVSRFFKIRGTNKGESFEAWVHKSGEIKFRGTMYSNPSGAAKAALGRAVNGWSFWRFKDGDGEWVKLDALRSEVPGNGRKGRRAPSGDRAEPADTVVVPARQEGFEEVFLGEERWWAIRLRKDKISAIKYIAAYRVRPVSAITHYAEVESIRPWKGGPKSVVNFKAPARRIGPIGLGEGDSAPQGLRYTSFARLKQAATLGEAFAAAD